MQTRRVFRQDTRERERSRRKRRRWRISATRRLDGIVNSDEELLNFSKRRPFTPSLRTPIPAGAVSSPLPLRPPPLSQPYKLGVSLPLRLCYLRSYTSVDYGNIVAELPYPWRSLRSSLSGSTEVARGNKKGKKRRRER